MPVLKYRIAYIDVTVASDELFRRISCRTEVRRAEKEGVTVVVHEHADRSAGLIAACRSMLEPLLAAERVPYDSSFDRLIAGPDNYLFVAYAPDGSPASFITVEKQAKSEAFVGKKAAYLSLSATNQVYKALCPNYLLIWRAIAFLRERGFECFNLGLLVYENCPDPDLERVAFFKRKWHGEEYVQHETVSWPVYLYYRYLKRHRFAKTILMVLRRFAKMF